MGAGGSQAGALEKEAPIEEVDDILSLDPADVGDGKPKGFGTFEAGT